MTDPTEKLRAGKGLLAAHLRGKRKAELEECLRSAVNRPLYGASYDSDQDKISDAIREVALPAIDQLKREKEADRIPRLIAPPITIPDSLTPAPPFRGQLLRKTRKGRPRKDSLADEAAKLRGTGLSYARIAFQLNREHGEGTATKESVRKLLASRKAKCAHGAALPPDKKPK
jgi:hypothetical protein